MFYHFKLDTILVSYVRGFFFARLPQLPGIDRAVVVVHQLREERKKKERQLPESPRKGKKERKKDRKKIQRCPVHQHVLPQGPIVERRVVTSKSRVCTTGKAEQQKASGLRTAGWFPWVWRIAQAFISSVVKSKVLGSEGIY